ncbi:hypothetical protein L227DRAFT_394362 [Lentinus tigrinus ALCF2SS1-6]|uniref:WD40 repeat-like protein n=1 Tax=Lentinus tigrinus ALCF2SS1-6 TaxID=1328759 RepID=A0A5C2SK69_9APHY|nr:hypothetical protein L227DRAFT_394362 [Lentinus tigrinus ALCF2SS1-6]
MAPPREILLESGLTKSLSFSNTGDFLAAIHQSHRILIWRVVDGSLIISTEVLEQRLDSCVWSRDDGLGVVSLAVLGIKSRRTRRVTLDTIIQDRFPCTVTVSDHNAGLAPAIPFSPPEHAAKHEVKKLEVDAVCAVCAQSSNGRLVAVVCTRRDWPRKCKIWLTVNSTTMSEAHRLTIHSAYPSSATFVGDDHFVVGSVDGRIKWWDILLFSFPTVATTTPHGTLSVYGTDVAVSRLTVSPRGSFLIAWNPLKPLTVLRRRHHLNLNPDAQSQPSSSDFCPHVYLEGHTGYMRDACLPLSLRTVHRHCLPRQDGSLVERCGWIAHHMALHEPRCGGDARYFLGGRDDLGLSGFRWTGLPASCI